MAKRIAFAGVLIAATVAIASTVTFDGETHTGPLQILGRLHPLLVHFPITLLLLVPVLEWMGRGRPALREAAGPILTLGMLASSASVLAGFALAFADGHEGSLLTRHMWGGVAVTICATLAWLTRERFRAVYWAALGSTLFAVVWAAHQGASLTHGEYYLTEPLPVSVKRALGIREPPVPEMYGADTVFGGAVRPVLEKHCLTCHGGEKTRGDFSMETFAGLLAGGKSGRPAILPGNSMDSELLRRLTLDPLDKKAMPPKRKPRPKPAEIALIRWWIKTGASRDQLLGAVDKAPPDVTALLSTLTESGSDSHEPVYVSRVGDYKALGSEIASLEKSMGVKIVPVSRRPGDGLILRTRGAEKTFGDAELKKLASVAPFIVEAELSGTRITDGGLAALRPFSHLERLHLDRTELTGATLGELGALPRLTYLNLCATKLTDRNLHTLVGFGKLEQLYLFGSLVSHEGLDDLRRQLPDCQIGEIAAPTEDTAASPPHPQ